MTCLIKEDHTGAGLAVSGCWFPDELAAQNKQECFIRGINEKVGVYDHNCHLCFSAYFNHTHILLSRSTLQSLDTAPPHIHTEIKPS